MPDATDCKALVPYRSARYLKAVEVEDTPEQRAALVREMLHGALPKWIETMRGWPLSDVRESVLRLVAGLGKPKLLGDPLDGLMVLFRGAAASAFRAGGLDIDDHHYEAVHPEGPLDLDDDIAVALLRAFGIGAEA